MHDVYHNLFKIIVKIITSKQIEDSWIVWFINIINNKVQLSS